MFARQAMPGWTAWGHESGIDSAPRDAVLHARLTSPYPPYSTGVET